MGFDAEVFGEDTALFRSIPPEWGTDGLPLRLKTLVGKLAEETDTRLLLDETLFEKLASEACRSSVLAREIVSIRLKRKPSSNQLFHWHSSRGTVRTEDRLVVRIPRGRFEEWFQRRV